tara:strand:+ start:1687 stop:2100 length:414 start_codon:yes stop_codon:yes gene_type:complete
MRNLFIIFIFLPIVEIYFFVKIGTEIGAVSTVIFTLITAMLGIFIIKYQGITSFVKARQTMLNNEEPAIEILSNFALLICGLLLLIPGFFTDSFGILLILPIVRKILIKYLIKKAGSNFKNSQKSKYKDYIDVDSDN